MTYFYRPQRKLREGNVFTGVCDSVHGGGVPGPGGEGVPGPGGCLLPGVPGPDPPGQLLLRAARILLECILVV